MQDQCYRPESLKTFSKCGPKYDYLLDVTEACATRDGYKPKHSVIPVGFMGVPQGLQDGVFRQAFG